MDKDINWKEELWLLANYTDALSSYAKNLEEELVRLRETVEISEALWRSRRILEIIVHDVFYHYFKYSPLSKKHSLDHQINQIRLSVNNDRVINAMHNIRLNGNKGAHYLHEVALQADTREIRIVFSSLSILIEWYIHDYQADKFFNDKRPIKVPQGVNPYKGLDAFCEADAQRFFGRKRIIKKVLWPRLQSIFDDQTGFLALVGPSGCGKSSLAQAGLIPFIKAKQASLSHIIMTPGNHPIERLVRSLVFFAYPNEPIVSIQDSIMERCNSNIDGLRLTIKDLHFQGRLGQGLVLLIDQFEELWTKCKAETQQSQFLELLIQASTDAECPIYLIMTLRSDFIEETQSHQKFNQLLATSSVIIPTLSEEELKEIISLPAKAAGYEFEEPFVQLLLGQCKGHDSYLPLLQFTLKELWSGIQKGKSPTKQLLKLKGVAGALVQRATDTYFSLSKENQLLVEKVFLKLVQINSKGTFSRQNRKLSELTPRGYSIDKVQSVLRIFSHRNLRLLTLTLDDDSSEIEASLSHESIVYHWDLIQQWIKSYGDDLRIFDRLDRAVNNWSQQGKAIGTLWRSPDLDLLTHLYEARSADFNDLQTEFYESSALQAKRSKKLKQFSLCVLLSFICILAYISILLYKQQTIIKQKSAMMVPIVTEKLLKEGDIDQALLKLMNATESFDQDKVPDTLHIAIYKALIAASSQRNLKIHPKSIIAKYKEQIAVVDPKLNSIYFYDKNLNLVSKKNDIVGKGYSITEVAEYKQDLIIIDSNNFINLYNPDGNIVHNRWQIDERSNINRLKTEIASNLDNFIIAIDTIKGKHDQIYKLIHIIDVRNNKYVYHKWENSDKLLLVKQKNKSIQILSYEDDRTNDISVLNILTNHEEINIKESIVDKNSLNGLIWILSGGGNHISPRYFKLDQNKRIFMGSTFGSGGGSRFAIISSVANPGGVDSDTSIDLPWDDSKIKFWGNHKKNKYYLATLDVRNLNIYNLDDDKFYLAKSFIHKSEPQDLFFLDSNTIVTISRNEEELNVYRINGNVIYEDAGPFELYDNELFGIPKARNMTLCNNISFFGHEMFGEDTSPYIMMTAYNGKSYKDHYEYIINLQRAEGKTSIVQNLNVKSYTEDDDDYYDVSYSLNGNSEQKVNLTDKAKGIIIAKDHNTLLIDIGDKVHIVKLTHLEDKLIQSGSLPTLENVNISGVHKFRNASFLYYKMFDTLIYELSLNDELDIQQQLIHKTKNPIRAVEPDVTNKRLLITEDSGSGYHNEYLYSLEAREVWEKFPSSYKRAYHTFNHDNTVCIRHKPYNLLLEGLDLSVLLRKGLSTHCRVNDGDSAKSSACWQDVRMP